MNTLSRTSGTRRFTTALCLSLVASIAVFVTPTAARAVVIEPPPTVTSVAPASGPESGGTSVTITGTNFVSGATVTFGGVAGTGVVFVDANTLMATTPAHAVGAVDVTVTNPSTLSGTLAAGFTYTSTSGGGGGAPPPVPVAGDPTQGPTAGGTQVTISGSEFVPGATTVTVDAVPVATTDVTASTIVLAMPPHAAGAVAIVVTTAGGSASVPGGFTYVAPTAAPNYGPTGGGTVVTLAGVGFQAGATVSFGGAAAATISVTSDTQIVATTPAHTAGTVSIEVASPGANTQTIVDAFTFTAPGQYGFYACGTGLPSPFVDIETSFARDHILCLYTREVTAGVTADSYGPTQPTTREQMAVFLMRVWEFATAAPYGGAVAAPFDDVSADMFGYARIHQLVGLGVTVGTGPGTFSPQAGVTREQMAVFMVRLWEAATGTTPAAAETPFTDIAGSFAETQIAQLLTLGITSGTSPTTFSPDAIVTREQMAQFVSRLLTAVSGRPGPASEPLSF